MTLQGYFGSTLVGTENFMTTISTYAQVSAVSLAGLAIDRLVI